MSAASDRHNRQVSKLVKEIVNSGRSPQDVLVLLESINTGVCTYVASTTTGGLSPQGLFDLMAAAMPDRFAELAERLLKPAGQA